jgi:hypothetical protein
MRHFELRTYGMTEIAAAAVVVDARVFLTTYKVVIATLISAVLILTSPLTFAWIWSLVLGVLCVLALRSTLASVKGAFNET